MIDLLSDGEHNIATTSASSHTYCDLTDLTDPTIANEAVLSSSAPSKAKNTIAARRKRKAPAFESVSTTHQ